MLKGSVVAHFCKRLLAGEVLEVFGDGEQTRDYLYFGDLTDGICQAIDQRVTGVYQLGTNIPTSLNQLLATLQEVVGDTYTMDVRYVDAKQGEIKHTWCDIAKARAEFSYDPQTPLYEGIQKTWHWFLQQKS